ncbi:MFS transporter [Sporomusa acidovorans]
MHSGNTGTAVMESLWTMSFVLTIFTNFLAYFGNFMLMSTLPLHVLHIGGNKIMAGLVTGIYSLTGFISRLKIGGLLDRKGRRPIMLAGLSLLLLTIISYNAAAYSIILLLALRAIHGISWSATTTSVSTLASDLIPAARRTEGMGLFGISMSSAVAVGPGLGLYLMEYYNHTALFLFSAVCIVLALLTGFWENRYYHTQTRVEAPIINKLEHSVGQITKSTVFEKKVIWPSFLFFIVMMTYSTIGIFLPAYASEQGIANIGLFFVVTALSTIFVRLVSGRVADRHGNNKVLIPGMVLLAVGLYLLSVARSFPLFLVAAVVYGSGHGAVQPTLNALVISLAPVERRGVANATFLCAMDIGLIIGSVIWGSVAQAFGFTYIYSTSMILIILSIAIYLVFSRGRLNA